MSLKTSLFFNTYSRTVCILTKINLTIERKIDKHI